jgi:hypothetical protein
MSKEKIYYKEGDVEVTASRVILGDKNFVLRNISSVQVHSDEWGSKGSFWGVGIMMAILGVANIVFMPILGVVCLVFSGLMFAAALAKDSHYVQVSSGGTPTNTIKSDTLELPQTIVEAINNALLDLDKNRTSDENDVSSDSVNSSADEIMKLKGLLDAGAITQEEFDTKKKKLLGL